jgi:lipopolysaccharide transport system ATP-binding protein
VGDAYFFGKCLQRFRAFQEAGRTSIVVSHDHSAIIRLCSRCIWLDHGRVVADGAPLDVVTLYSRSVAGRLDMRVAKGWTTQNIGTSPSYAVQSMNGIAIDAVVFVNAEGRAVQSIDMGESLTIRTQYNSNASFERAAVAVVVIRADGLTVCNAISSMDGVYFDLVDGAGTIDLMFDRVLLGPGDYSVVVGIYPTLDLDDSGRAQHAAVWREPRTLSVAQPVGIAMDLGVVRHPARWRNAGRTQATVQAAAPSRST